MDLDELLERVNSKSTFLEFVDALKQDKIDEDEKEKINPSSPYGPRANRWENGTISEYLDALHSFGEDSEQIKEQADWKTFALLLYAGKFYE